MHLFGLASWAVFGGALERLGGGFRGSLGVLEASWERLGLSWRRGSVFGGAWGRLGRVWETPGKRLRASLGCFFQSLKRL